MRIIRDLQELSTPLPGAVVTIGNFDGVHLGHREIFRRVVRRAGEIGGTSAVLTFVPHPLKLLAPERAPRLINTYQEKERLIAASCIDVLFCLPFTRALAALPAERFVREILVGRIGVQHLIVGYDYAFGRNREGDVAFLHRCGKELGFSLEVLGPVAAGNLVYSSTRIRTMLLAGEVAEVVALLGRHFTLEGQVVHGAGRGNRLGYPTANLNVDKELLPKAGVYAVKVRRGEKVLSGVANIGSNPTFDGEGVSLEVHLFDFHGDLYGEPLRLYFVQRLRDEKRFPSVQELVKAIAADVARAKDILTRTRIVEYREYLDCGMAEGVPSEGETE